MISSAEPERRRPFFAYALVFSLLVHLLLGIGFTYHPFLRMLHPQPRPSDEFVATTDTIRLDRRPVQREAQRQPQQPPQRPVPPRPHVAAQPPMPLPTLAPPKQTTTPLPSAPPASAAPTPAAKPLPRHVAAATIHRPAAAGGTPDERAAKPALSREQLDQMESQFRQTIAQTRADLLSAPPPRATPAALRKYDLIMNGKPEDLVNFQGSCDQVKSWQTGNDVFRYLRCNVTYSDGYSETVDFPWPFHWSVQRDPYLVHSHFPIQPPPPGYQLAQGAQISRAVCIFFKERCAGIFKREVDVGGPATSSSAR